jgi:hypothetical protein
MKRWSLGGCGFGLVVLYAVTAVSQTPQDEGHSSPNPPPPGPPRFELGQLFPPPLRRGLDLTPAQQAALADVEKAVKERLETILTAEQQRQIADMPPPRLPGPPRGPRQQGPRGEPSTPLPLEAIHTLVKNPQFTLAGADSKEPAGYLLEGDVRWTRTGGRDENAPWGISLHSGEDRDADGRRTGSVAQDVTGFEGGTNAWFRFSFRGLAESGFAVKNDGLFMRADYYSKKGSNYLDGVTRKLYPLVQRDRLELASNGNFRKNGGAVWKTYAMEFKLPFPEIDQIRLSVGFKDGCADSKRDSVFYLTDFALAPIPAPPSAPKVIKTAKGYEPSVDRLVAVGGRWYYEPESERKEGILPLTVKHTNAGRLYYRDSRLTNPFAENMTAWLRKGYKDVAGEVIQKDRLIADNVVVRFEDDRTMIVRSRNLPNHATAQFPDLTGTNGFNPSYIQEHDDTYYLPLNPVRNPRAVALDATNSNRALPMGPIGIAINGVVFFNPFDAGMRDASDIMDRCCGHPNPDNQYHYHKYPVCVKSPFVDEGEEHSPLIGWAFDGFPIYGPYERKGVMAKDDTDNPLNAFNIHYDEVRGWHYHVTPGKFPYIIGGYWGEADRRNFRRPLGPRPRPGD